MKQWIVDGQEFAAGNVVRVMRQIADGHPNGMGFATVWENAWCEEMDKYLGMTFVVEDIEPEGVSFEGAGELSFLFPLAALDFISATKQVKDAA